MKRMVKFSLYLLASTWGLAAVAATPSVNGSNIFAEPYLIDEQNNTWSIVDGVIKKNGVHAASNYNVNLLLEYNQNLYQRNTSNDWYMWTAGTWSGTSDPRVVSASGARIGVGTEVLVDSEQHIWTLPSDEYAYRDGLQAGGNYNTIRILYYNKVIYCENGSGNWYSWNGSTWTQISGDPTVSTATGTRTPSANGTSIGVGSNILVDSKGNAWTLPSTEYASVNGARADGNYNTVLVLYFNSVIYCENTSGDWYSWNGSSWTRVSGNPETVGVSGAAPPSSDPRGPNLAQYVSYTSPVCPANNPTCTPPFVDNSSVAFSKATTKGDAIWVAVTVSDYSGAHAVTVTDSQHNTYHQLNQGNDPAPGSQSVAQFYAANIAGGADTVTVNWGADNYKGVLAAEIAGVTASPLLGNSVNIQDGGMASSSNNLTSKTISVASSPTPSLLVALTMDTDGGGSDTGGTGFCAVPAGSGFTLVAQLWSWSPAGQAACNLATFETETTSAGSVAGSFTTAHDSDPYVTVVAVFR